MYKREFRAYTLNAAREANPRNRNRHKGSGINPATPVMKIFGEGGL
jgi:hypothetical protein